MSDLAARLHAIFATTFNLRGVGGVTGVTAEFSGVTEGLPIVRPGVVATGAVTPINSATTPVTPLTPQKGEFPEKCVSGEPGQVKYVPSPASWRDAEQERAAIIEYDGRVPRIWAEGLARLCTMARPFAFSQQRWAHIVDDAGHFVDDWAERAVELGWTTQEIFGVDPARPEACQFGRGLVSLLDGRRVTNVLFDRVLAVPATGGSVVTFYRTKQQDRVPVWDLGQ